MADDTRSLTPAKVWFAAHGEGLMDITKFHVREVMNEIWRVELLATTMKDAAKESLIAYR